jgi:pimeloyl-ACP methyl ester carboxylesterase
MADTQFVRIGDASIAFDVTGSGHPIVLLHAGLGDRRMWDDQVPTLAGHFTVIRFDARGFGETRRTSAEFRAWQDVVALLDHLGNERAHLVGVSMGSQTALDTAVAAPERVSAVVAVAARTGVPASESLRAGWKAVDELFEAGDIDGANEYELRMWVDGPNRGAEAVPAAVRERVRVMNLDLLTRDDTEDNEHEPDPPTEDGLSSIACPTLVVWGDQDVSDVQTAGPQLVATIPDARQAIIPGTAHLPNMEKPDEFNRILLDFLHEATESSR